MVWLFRWVQEQVFHIPLNLLQEGLAGLGHVNAALSSVPLAVTQLFLILTESPDYCPT